MRGVNKMCYNASCCLNKCLLIKFGVVCFIIDPTHSRCFACFPTNFWQYSSIISHVKAYKKNT